MNRTLRYLALLGAVGLLVAAITGIIAPQRVDTQTGITTTTTSATVARAATSVALTSDAGVAAGTFLYVDSELMQALSEIGTSSRWNVRRATADGASVAVPHASGAFVYVLPTTSAGQSFVTYDVSGTCTPTDFSFAPLINTKLGHIFDCDQGQWMQRNDNTVFVSRNSVRDSFDRGYTVMQDDGTAKSLADTEVNFVTGSPLGAIEYREEQAKTASSWVIADGALDISADDTTTDEGVEIIFGSAAGTTNSWMSAGTTGGCISASITIADISGTDQVVIGFRQNEAYQDAAAYTGYTRWHTVGVTAVDGSITSKHEVSESTLTDDSGVDWSDGQTRALKVCISKAGVPSAYYSNASPANYPVWNQIALANGSGTFTAGTDMVPFLSYLAESTDGADVTVNWVQLTTLQ